jgi:mono/diheme cytochrome c family protein
MTQSVVQPRIRTCTLLAALSILSGCGLAEAKNPSRATVARGEHLARLVCSACHVVAADQEIPPLLQPPAPSFSSIAGRPGTTAKGIRHFVMTTHWDMKTIPMTMPDMMMMPEDASAVAAYIMSLEKHPASARPEP